MDGIVGRVEIEDDVRTVDGNDATGKLTVARVSHRRYHELSLSVEQRADRFMVMREPP